MPTRQPHNAFLGVPVPRYGYVRAALSPADLVFMQMVREHLALNGDADPTDDDVVSYALYACSRMTVSQHARNIVRRKGG